MNFKHIYSVQNCHFQFSLQKKEDQGTDSTLPEGLVKDLNVVTVDKLKVPLI